MKKIILILILILLITSCANIGKKKVDTTDIFRCKSFGPGRGIVVDFIEDAPPREIKEGREFTVSLKFANFNKNAMDAEYLVQDNSDSAKGFEDQKGTVSIEPATFEEKDGILRLHEPGCNILGEDLPEKNLGIFVYQPEFDEDIEFTAEIKYDYTSLAYGFFCVYDVNREKTAKTCSIKEVLSGENALGLGTRYDPVTVTRVEKKLIGLQPQVLVNLDIFIGNLVDNGIVDTENGEVVEFTLNSPDTNFDCTSDNIVAGSKKGNSLGIYLRDKKAIVNCLSKESVDRFAKYGFNVELRYPFSYFARTGPIDLIKTKSS